MSNINILGIESSCDDTSAAVIQNGVLKSNLIANQKIHEKYGGVIPEIASREHQKNIIPVVDQAIKEADIKKEDLSAVAFTQGPGLKGSLLVGNSFAKGLSLGLKIPLIQVNHIHGHILSSFIIEKEKETIPNFPFICLVVSGGHTQFFYVKNYFKIELIGTTLDDAAGETYDKAAKMLGLEYPGGPIIDNLAKKGNCNKFKFTTPNVKNFDFSFSGIKTNILYFINKEKKQNKNFVDENIHDLCSSIQETINKYLIMKLEKAMKEYKTNEVCVTGGVAANSNLRSHLKRICETNKYKLHLPPIKFCTDNAAMIANIGYHKFLNKKFTNQETKAKSRQSIQEI
ncbi:MAG: tRNA (adenosine(37)-N6)-threonylcarbamoyltransferase complex transferase subunit TsaD [Flavobacteriales bacterium]|nr:tRNA (adenosine(37)-N6)-threonylcarbamoyltransferase complex transferase subunit TsaD [Flavobacteriales bacterium]